MTTVTFNYTDINFFPEPISGTIDQSDTSFKSWTNENIFRITTTPLPYIEPKDGISPTDAYPIYTLTGYALKYSNQGICLPDITFNSNIITLTFGKLEALEATLIGTAYTSENPIIIIPVEFKEDFEKLKSTCIDAEIIFDNELDKIKNIDSVILNKNTEVILVSTPLAESYDGVLLQDLKKQIEKAFTEHKNLKIKYVIECRL